MEKNFNKNILDWKNFPEYDLIWTDPPWGDRMVKFFYTQIEKDTGEKIEPPKVNSLLNQLGKLADTKKPLIIEYQTDNQELIRIMQSYGHVYFGKHVSFYQKNPFNILVFNVNVPIIITKKEPDIIPTTLSRTKYKVVFDPFAGIGNTAKGVRKAGLTYIGSEINPKRFQKLVQINK